VINNCDHKNRFEPSQAVLNHFAAVMPWTSWVSQGELDPAFSWYEVKVWVLMGGA
jgi:hypothetical protein